jgi:hypothetical protein
MVLTGVFADMGSAVSGGGVGFTLVVLSQSCTLPHSVSVLRVDFLVNEFLAKDFFLLMKVSGFFTCGFGVVSGALY